MVVATCVFLVRHYTDGSIKVLTVSRKNNPNDIGLPGGKMEDIDKSIKEAAQENSWKKLDIMLILIV